MPDLEWLATREQAETIPYTYCGAAPGETCTRPEPHTGLQITVENLPAHAIRVRASRASTQERNK